MGSMTLQGPHLQYNAGSQRHNSHTMERLHGAAVTLVSEEALLPDGPLQGNLAEHDSHTTREWRPLML